MIKLCFCILMVITFGVKAQTNSHPGGGLPKDPGDNDQNCVTALKEIKFKEKQFTENLGQKYLDEKSFFSAIEVISLSQLMHKIHDSAIGPYCPSDLKTELKKILDRYEDGTSCREFENRNKYIPLLKNIIRNYE